MTLPYDASQIQVLSGLDAVRRRPSMYIGSTDAFGLHRLAFELIDNAVDEILAGFGSRIDVAIHSDGSLSVADDGRGIPVDPHPGDGRPGCEVVLTTLHAGAKFDRSAYRVSGGLLGIGLSCVNALAAWLELEVRRSGACYRQRYVRGTPTTRLEASGPDTGRGTGIRFLPAPEVFPTATFDHKTIGDRLEALAFLNPGLTLRLTNRQSGVSEDYHFAGGLGDFVAHRNHRRTTLHPDPIVIAERVGELDIQLALQWTRGYAEDLVSYANCIHTPDGGSHVEGLRAALLRVLNAHARANGLMGADDDPIQGLDLAEGLTCILAVQLPEPEFEGPTKARLRQEWVAGAVREAVAAALDRVFAAAPQLASTVAGRCLEAARTRWAVRRASERAHYRATPYGFDEDVYRGQFTVRSKNWHESATWITHDELLAAHAAECLAPADAKLLDVCCGSGVVGAAFRGRVGHTVGLDLTPAMADLARSRLDEVHLGNVYHLPFADGAFDIVVTREVLHLLPRPEIPVREVFRVLRPGGQFIVGQTLPYSRDDAAWMWRIFKKKQPLVCNMFQTEDFTRLLVGAGFGQVRLTDLQVWEDIDRWIDTHETSNLHRHEIRRLYRDAPALVRAIHPFEISGIGRIRDQWRWGVFSAVKPFREPPA